MSLKQNNLVWKKAPLFKYTTFKEHKGLVSVMIPLDETQYRKIRADVLSSKYNIPLFDGDKIFADISIMKQQIAMLATQEAIFAKYSDIEHELSDIIPEPVYGAWLFTKYDRKYNMIGYEDKIAKITQTFNRRDIFEEQLGTIGNPDYFIIIRIDKRNINRLTYEGIKRIKVK